MRQLSPHLLWIGHVGDARDTRAVLSAGIAALVDLACNEPPVRVTRELVYCRFPLLDGSGNPPWLLRAAVATTVQFVRARVPTLVFCGAGMSRSPVVAAAALATVTGRHAEEVLRAIVASGPADVSPGLWRDALHLLTELPRG